MDCPVCGDEVAVEDNVIEPTVCKGCGYDFESGEDEKPFRAEVD